MTETTAAAAPVRYRVLKKCFIDDVLYDPATMADPHITARAGLKSAALQPASVAVPRQAAPAGHLAAGDVGAGAGGELQRVNARLAEALTKLVAADDELKTYAEMVDRAEAEKQQHKTRADQAEIELGVLRSRIADLEATAATDKPKGAGK